MANVNYISKGNENSIFRRELMKDDYVNIKYNSTTCETIAAGTPLGTTVEGQSYKVMEDYMPSYNENNDSFVYDIKFKAWYYELEKVLMKAETKVYKNEDDEDTTDVINAAEWTLTDTPANFCALIKKNGVSVNSSFNVVLDCNATQLPARITCTFNGTNVLDAISMVTKALDEETGYYEWWFVGNELHIGKLTEQSTQTAKVLALGSNIASVNVQEGTAKSIKTLYAYSAAKNISPRYGKPLCDIAAITEMTIEDDNEIAEGGERGTKIGYYDPNHQISASMFKSSARIYPTMSGYQRPTKEDRVSMKEGYLLFRPTYLNYAKSGKAKVTFGTATNGSLEFRLVGQSEVTEGRDITLSLIIGEYSQDYRAIIEDIAVIDQFKLTGWKGASCTFSMKLNNIEFNATDNSYYCVALKLTKDGSEILTLTPNAVLYYTIQSLNYACGVGNGIMFNPYYYPTNQLRSRCFNTPVTITDDNYKTYNLIQGKMPYSWFADSNKPTLMSFDQRLCYVKENCGGKYETQMVFEDVYPTMSGTIGNDISIKSEDEKDTNGETTGRLLQYCSFVCGFLKDVDTSDFTEDKATIIFTSGQLNGMEFELNVAKTGSTGTTLCIIPNENYNALIPCEGLMPAEGDTYKIVGIDVCYYESADLMAAALTELTTKAEAYVKTMNANQNVYTLRLIPTSVATTKPVFGDKVRLSDIGLTTRVIGVEYPLDLQAADYKVICGNSPSYKRISALENKTLTLK